MGRAAIGRLTVIGSLQLGDVVGNLDAWRAPIQTLHPSVPRTLGTLRTFYADIWQEGWKEQACC